jgi:hypothetical protein
MSIILDGSSLITVQLMYIEHVDDKFGTTTFHFLRSKEDFAEWKKKGYLTTDEIEEIKKQQTIPEAPGSPQRTYDPKKVITILRTWWNRMTWKEQNQTYARCLTQIPDGEGKTRTELNLLLFRELTLKTCLKKWDLKDNGKEVALGDKVIDSLVPEVAQELLSTFEKLIEPKEKDLGE